VGSSDFIRRPSGAYRLQAERNRLKISHLGVISRPFFHRFCASRRLARDFSKDAEYCDLASELAKGSLLKVEARGSEDVT
jgi:hypothetical protein